MMPARYDLQLYPQRTQQGKCLNAGGQDEQQDKGVQIYVSASISQLCSGFLGPSTKVGNGDLTYHLCKEKSRGAFCSVG